MKIDPNKQPPPKPVPSATEQVMQVVKWVIVIWVAKSMFTPIFAAINDRGGKFGKFAEQSKRDLAQIKSAAKEAENSPPTVESPPIDTLVTPFDGSIEPHNPPIIEKTREALIPVPAPVDAPVANTNSVLDDSESQMSAIGCGQATRIVNNSPEMVESCAKFGVTLRGEDPSEDHNKPVPEVFDANGKDGSVVVIYTENRLGKAAEDCKKIDRNNNTDEIVKYCDQFANGNTFGEPTE